MALREDMDKLPDNAQWCNRVEIKSESSNRVYIVAQNKEKRYWMCSCPGGKTKRNCKHLRNMGLPGNLTPFELENVMPTSKKSIMDGYKTYSGTPGKPEEWRDKVDELTGEKTRQQMAKVAKGGRVISFEDEV